VKEKVIEIQLNYSSFISAHVSSSSDHNSFSLTLITPFLYQNYWRKIMNFFSLLLWNLVYVHWFAMNEEISQYLLLKESIMITQQKGCDIPGKIFSCSWFFINLIDRNTILNALLLAIFRRKCFPFVFLVYEQDKAI